MCSYLKPFKNLSARIVEYQRLAEEAYSKAQKFAEKLDPADPACLAAAKRYSLFKLELSEYAV